MDVLVEADRLRKTFGPIVAVDEISLKVARGEVLGFLGPNGAGKSTTMKMLTGFLEPDSGTARICGLSMADRSKQAKAKIGYLPEGAPAYGDMTAGAFLRFIAEVRGYNAAARDSRILAAVMRTGLENVVDQRIETLSKGFKRRVGLAQAILHDPPVLIMDEPTDGLDPNQKHHVRSLIADMAKDKAIIVSTHILEEVEAVCTRALVIDRGRVVADGTAEQLQRRMPYHNAVALKVDTSRADAIAAALSGLPRVATVERQGAVDGHVQLRAIPKGGAMIVSDVAALLSERSLPVAEMFVERGRLDEVFRKITSEEAARPHA
ncbi:MAG: ABC transporter ATP-binding protein [Hyphomicrobiaceae bacterium]|nr:ABC transporter ATP-binding protein [Hyphomicrobiaceae bacterium]